MLILRHPGKGYDAGPGQPLPLISEELPGGNYKVIFCWLLPVLDLEECGRGHVANQG